MDISYIEHDRVFVAFCCFGFYWEWLPCFAAKMWLVWFGGGGEVGKVFLSLCCRQISSVKNTIQLLLNSLNKLFITAKVLEFFLPGADDRKITKGSCDNMWLHRCFLGLKEVLRSTRSNKLICPVDTQFPVVMLWENVIFWTSWVFSGWTSSVRFIHAPYDFHLRSPSDIFLVKTVINCLNILFKRSLLKCVCSQFHIDMIA